jgi:hypothetical protein
VRHFIFSLKIGHGAWGMGILRGEKGKGERGKGIRRGEKGEMREQSYRNLIEIFLLSCPFPFTLFPFPLLKLPN